MCRFLLLLITFHVMLSDIIGMAPLILIYLIIILVPDLNLEKIKLPLEAMQCEDVLCNKHRRDIDVFYSAITNCLHGCIKQCIPVLKLQNDNSVAGWN